MVPVAEPAVTEDGGLSDLLERDISNKAVGTEATLAALDSALRPVEKYAVKWLEQVRRKHYRMTLTSLNQDHGQRASTLIKLTAGTAKCLGGSLEDFA